MSGLCDIYVLSEGVEWETGCLTCGWHRTGFARLPDAEDCAAEHACTRENGLGGGAA